MRVKKKKEIPDITIDSIDIEDLPKKKKNGGSPLKQSPTKQVNEVVLEEIPTSHKEEQLKYNELFNFKPLSDIESSSSFQNKRNWKEMQIG